MSTQKNQYTEVYKVLEVDLDETVIRRESFLVDTVYLESLIKTLYPQFDGIEEFMDSYIPDTDGAEVYEVALTDGEIIDEASFSIEEDEEDYISILDISDEVDMIDFDEDFDEDFDDDDDELDESELDLEDFDELDGSEEYLEKECCTDENVFDKLDDLEEIE